MSPSSSILGASGTPTDVRRAEVREGKVGWEKMRKEVWLKGEGKEEQMKESKIHVCVRTQQTKY